MKQKKRKPKKEKRKTVDGKLKKRKNYFKKKNLD